MTDYDEQLLSALDDLVAAVKENNQRNAHVVKRAQTIVRLRRRGRPWREIVSEEHKPLIVELLTQNMAVLGGVGSQIRRLEAKVLHDEGMSMEQIAALFGVTRQRISELLRQEEEAASRSS